MTVSANDIAFTPDGNHIAVAGSDKTASVWELASGTEHERATLNEVARVTHIEAVLAVSFSHDGRPLGTASEDESAAIWLWKPKDLIAETSRRLPERPAGPKESSSLDPALVPKQVIVPFIAQDLILGKRK